jgi:hypothetical protein
MTPDELDVAIAMEDPRLAGTPFEDPLSRNIALRGVVMDTIRLTEHQFERGGPYPPDLQLRALDALAAGEKMMPSASELAVAHRERVQLIHESLPAMRAHLQAVAEAGLLNATELASAAIAHLEAYLHFVRSAADGH